MTVAAAKARLNSADLRTCPTETIVFVTVVPIFAPMIIGTAAFTDIAVSLPLPTSPAFSPKFCEGLKVPSRRRCTTSAAALAGAVSPLRAHVAAAAAAVAVRLLASDLCVDRCLGRRLLIKIFSDEKER